MTRPPTALRYAALASFAAVALVACGSGSASPGPSRTGGALARVATPQPFAPATMAPSSPQFLTFKDGTHQVGKDIQPGTYRTRTKASSCSWQRLSGFGGTFDEIIANINVTGFAVVTIASTDKGFESSRCGTWSSDLSAVVSGDSFGDGTYIVGTDIQPGTYRTGGGTMCYFERMSGFGGTFEEIIANDTPAGGASVQIEAGDTGFSSTGCGTWTRT